MKCYIHENKDAAGTCQKCGKAICKECVVDYHGQMLCTTCVMPLSKFFGGDGTIPGDIGPERKKKVDDN